mgnify:FL=1
MTSFSFSLSLSPFHALLHLVLYLNVHPGSPNILVTDKRYLYGSPAYGRSGTTAFAGKIKDAVVIADVEKKKSPSSTSTKGCVDLILALTRGPEFGFMNLPHLFTAFGSDKVITKYLATRSK